MNDPPNEPAPAVPKRKADAVAGRSDDATVDAPSLAAQKPKQQTKTKTVRLNAMSMSEHIRNISDQNTKSQP